MLEIVLDIMNNRCNGTKVWKGALLHPKSHNTSNYS